MTALAPAAQARAKLASRRAIDLAGGVEAAALAVGRGKSTVGRWHALNDPDLPPFDAMLTLDQIAVAQGHLPALISHLASECGGAFLPMPSVQGDDEFLRQAGAIAEGAGQLIGGIAGDLADGQMSQREAMARIAAADALAATVGGLCQRLRERAGAK
jgi:hypothetical protein